MKRAIPLFFLVCLTTVSLLHGQVLPKGIPTDSIRTVTKIWDKAPHNGFPDLIRFKNYFYVALREGNSHMPDKSGKVRIIRSKDGNKWESMALLEMKDEDMREARLSVTPKGQIMVISASGVFDYQKKGYVSLIPVVSFSDTNGENFSAPVPVKSEGYEKNAIDWIWKVTWNKGKGYGVLYRIIPAGSLTAMVLETTDGLTFRLLKKLDITGNPSEAAIKFDAQDKMYVIVRRDRMGMLVTSLPPYSEWNYSEMKINLGGPEMMLYDNQSMLIGTRYIQGKKPSTVVMRTDQKGDVEKVIKVPSGGDTSYPGFLIYKKKLWMVYYSSHENNKAEIYLAKIPVRDLKVKGKR